MLVAHNWKWDTLEIVEGEEILVKTLTLNEALAGTREDYRYDPQAALALWIDSEKLINVVPGLS